VSETTSISDGCVVEIEFTLKDDGGHLLDASEGDPLVYLHGADNIVPGLENALSGRTVGEKLDVVVSPEDGYGRRMGAGPQSIDRAGFPDGAELYVGMEFAVETEDGLLPLYVVEVREDSVIVDVNHPLAGATLHFSVEVVGIRDSTEEERAHGHPHGPGGAHH
jgi:FKBP-type peptidyl-prolyl cis-trans isomerase SlyD